MESYMGSLTAISSMILINFDSFSCVNFNFSSNSSILLTKSPKSPLFFGLSTNGGFSETLNSIIVPICFNFSSMTMKYSLTPSIRALKEARISYSNCVMIVGVWDGWMVTKEVFIICSAMPISRWFCRFSQSTLRIMATYQFSSNFISLPPGNIIKQLYKIPTGKSLFPSLLPGNIILFRLFSGQQCQEQQLVQSKLHRTYTIHMENRQYSNENHIRRIVSQYELSDLLGEGSYSQVFKARHLENSHIFAVKVVSNKILAENGKVKEYINNQLAIHNQLQPCPYIVRFFQLLQTRNNCYFVYEYCEGGTLLEMIKRQKSIDERKALRIFSQLIKGLKVLRKHNIMHRDLKPQNVLIKEGNFKLADFGFCKELGGEHMTRTMLGSPLYMAPEVLRGEAYSVNADVWSVGVILYEMLYGHCPFQSNSIASLITTIDDTYLVFDPSITISLGVRKFITKCLQKDCKKRIAWDALFDEVNLLLESCEISNNSSNKESLDVPSTLSRRNIMKSNTANFEEQADRSLTLKRNHVSATSKSKYQIFKDNYNRINNNTQIFSNTLDLSKNDKSRTVINKHNDQYHGDKDKQAAKISYSQIVGQHEACWKMIKFILQRLETRDKATYSYAGLMLKEVKRVLDKIYSKINLDDCQMLPVLSVVKYELIQIEKMIAEVEKALPLQCGEESGRQKIPACMTQQWSQFQHTCIN